MQPTSLLQSFVEIRLHTPDDFLKIRETLSRIGVASTKDHTLFQSVHILHKQGRYFLTHFKELFALDGKETNLDLLDIGRRNAIAKLLEEWKLCTIVNPAIFEGNFAPLHLIKIIPHREKSAWQLVVKYTIGKKTIGTT
jgi:Bacteriophage translational regulator